MMSGKARFHLKPYASRRVWIPRFNLDTNIKFIEEYRKHPCLWDPGDPNYMKHKPRFQAYEEMAKAMQYPGLDAASVRSKIKILRSCYISSRKQIAAKAGTSTPHKPVDWFWAADNFLHDVIRLGFSEPQNINEEYQYLRNNFEHTQNTPNDQAEVYFGTDMPVSSTVEVVESTNDEIGREEIYEEGECEIATEISSAPISIKREMVDESEENSIYLELDDDQLMAIENGEMSIEDVAAKAEAAASQQQQELAHQLMLRQQQIEIPNLAKPARRGSSQENKSSRGKSRNLEEDKGEEALSAESETEDEFDVFGRCVAFQLKALPVDIALDLESQIHTLITKKRMVLLRKNKLRTHSQSECP